MPKSVHSNPEPAPKDSTDSPDEFGCRQFLVDFLFHFYFFLGGGHHVTVTTSSAKSSIGRQFRFATHTVCHISYPHVFIFCLALIVKSYAARESVLARDWIVGRRAKTRNPFRIPANRLRPACNWYHSSNAMSPGVASAYRPIIGFLRTSRPARRTNSRNVGAVNA